jgi:hypothetical protein
MKCNEILELMPDLAAGLTAASPEVNEHVKACAGCAAKLVEFRQTMALLDEWKAPEPSPYFDTRLQARLREEAARKPSRVWQWLSRPALAGALAVAVVAGVTLMQREPGKKHNDIAVVTPGTAVGDLQALDKNGDIYADFDVLDDLQVQPDVTANP